MMISIIITTYNRSDYLLKCLDSLSRQKVSTARFEVLVIDNNCTDDTSELVPEFIKNHPDLDAKYFLESNQGLTWARNCGIREASGDLITFIDDDAMAGPAFCQNLYDAAQKYSDYAAFGGPVNPVFKEGHDPAWLSSFVWGIVAKIDLGTEVRPFTKKYPAGCNMSFRKTVFDEIGLFNTDVKFRSDDKDIFNRIKAKELKVLYLPDIPVDHNIPEERATKKGIRRISILSGSGEKNRLKGNPGGMIMKFLDYSFKLSAAILLSIFFILKGEPKKSLIIKIMFWSLQGFVGNEKRLLDH